MKTLRRLLCGVLSAAMLLSIPAPAFATNGGGSTAINGGSDPLAAVSEEAGPGTAEAKAEGGAESGEARESYVDDAGHRVIFPTREELFRDLYVTSKAVQTGEFKDDNYMCTNWVGLGYQDRYIAENYRGLKGRLIRVGPFLSCPNAAIAGIEGIPYADLLDLSFPFRDRGNITRAMSADFRVMYAKYGDDALTIHDYWKMKVRLVARGGNPKGQVFSAVIPETVQLYAGNNDSVLFIYQDGDTGFYRVFCVSDGAIKELFPGEHITGYFYDLFQNATTVTVAVKTADGYTFKEERTVEGLFSITMPDGSLEIRNLSGLVITTVSAEENASHKYPLTGYGIYWRVRGAQYYWD